MNECKSDVHVPKKDALSISFMGKLGAESCRFAKKIDELNYIYALYGLLDGLSLSYSMVKYLFDLLPTDNQHSSSEKMHNWLVTPEGVAIAALESITLIAFSLLANIYSEKDEAAFKRYIAIAWPYCRDSMKGLKNAYKGIRSTFLALSSITGNDLTYMIAPVGIALGVLSVLNRYCMRKFVKEPRIAMTKFNAKLLLEIKATRCHLLQNMPPDVTSYLNSFILIGELGGPPQQLKLFYVNSDKITEVRIEALDQFAKQIKAITVANEKLYLSDQQIKEFITQNGGYIPPLAGHDEAACDAFRTLKKTQTTELNGLALLGAAYGGVVDGLYLYMGALALAVLSSPAFMVMTVCSVIFSLMCVITRVYEEYDFQRRFHGTQAKIELALCGKELEALLATLQRLSNPFKQLNDAVLAVLLDKVQSRIQSTAIVQKLGVLQTLLTLLSKPQDEHNVPSEWRKDIQDLRQVYNEKSDHGASDALQKELEEELLVIDNVLLTNLSDGIEAVRHLYIEKLKGAYKEALMLKKAEFESERDKLRLQVTLSHSLAVLAGLRNGLAAFSAITSLMFAVAAVNALFLIAFPPELLLVGVGVGMVCLVVFVAHSLISNSTHLINETVSKANHPNQKLIDLLESVKGSQKQVQDLQLPEVEAAITGGMVVDPSPQFFIQEWFEVIRSLGSGLYKGPKLVEFVQNIFQGLGLNSDDNDTPILFQITIASAVVQALTFSLRALARGFGRDAPDVVQVKKIPAIKAAQFSWFGFFSRAPTSPQAILTHQRASSPS